MIAFPATSNYTPLLSEVHLNLRREKERNCEAPEEAEDLGGALSVMK